MIFSRLRPSRALLKLSGPERNVNRTVPQLGPSGVRTVPFLFFEVCEIFPQSSLKSEPRSSVERSELVGAVSVHTTAMSDRNQAPALTSADRRVSVFYGSLDRYHHVTMSID